MTGLQPHDDGGREHTADCYANGCTTGAHPAPRPGHPFGGPWTLTEALTAAKAARDALGGAR